MTDYDGNSSSVEFSLIGKLQEPPLPKKEGIYFSYAVDNLYKKDDFGIFVPAGALYENLDFTRRKIPSKKYCSDIHIIAPSVPPLHKAAEISVRLTEDKLSDKRQYYLVRLDMIDPIRFAGSMQMVGIRLKLRSSGLMPFR